MKLLKSMTTSYELSLRLKELGVEQTAEYRDWEILGNIVLGNSFPATIS